RMTSLPSLGIFWRRLLGGLWREQIPERIAWFGALAETGQAVAFCSGNHDLDDFGRLVSNCSVMELPAQMREKLVDRSWLACCQHPNLHGPECCRIVDLGKSRVIITALPWRDYNVPADKAESLPDYKQMRDAQRMSLREGCPWIVVAHEPPSPSKLSPEQTPNALYRMVHEFQPDLVVSGHYHEQPFTPGGASRDQIGKTVCVNPGRREG